MAAGITAHLTACGFLPEVIAEVPAMLYRQPDAAGERLLARLQEPADSPTALLDQLQRLSQTIRREVFAERIGGEPGGGLVSALQAASSFLLFKRGNARLRYQIVLLVEWDEPPAWASAVLAGAVVNLPRRCVLPVSLIAGGQVAVAENPAPEEALKNCLAWLEQLWPCI